MTIRDLLKEAEISKELLSAGTGKKIIWFTDYQNYSGSCFGNEATDGARIQIVRTEDGKYDFYASDDSKMSRKTDPHKCKELYKGSFTCNSRDVGKIRRKAYQTFINDVDPLCKRAMKKALKDTFLLPALEKND